MLLRDRAARAAPTSGSRSSASGASRSPGSLSGGEQQMLSLAPALADPPDGAHRRRAHARARAARGRRGHARRDSSSGTSAARCCSSRSTRRNALDVADTLAFMELGTLVWFGPRDEADVDFLAASYLGEANRA